MVLLDKFGLGEGVVLLGVQGSLNFCWLGGFYQTRSGGTVGVMLGGCVEGQSYLGFRALT